MRHLLNATCLLVLAAAALQAVEPPKSDGAVTPKAAPFTFPLVVPKSDPPAPQPMPGVVPVLTSDTLYVIPSDESFLLFASPEGSVKVTRASGPLTLFAKFLGGSGEYESKTITAKHVAIVQSVAGAKGRVELIAVPAGATNEAAAVRQLIDVNHGAQPPPKPDEIPPPKPVPVTSFRVLFVHESGNTLTTAQHSVIYGKSVSDYLIANCTKDGAYAGWLRLDKDTEAPAAGDTMKALWSAVKPKLPATMPVVVIEVNGKADILPLAATPAEMVNVFRKYGGK